MSEEVKKKKSNKQRKFQIFGYDIWDILQFFNYIAF